MIQKGKALLSDVKDNDFDYNEEAFYWLVAHVYKFPAELMKPDKDDTPSRSSWPSRTPSGAGPSPSAACT